MSFKISYKLYTTSYKDYFITIDDDKYRFINYYYYNKPVTQIQKLSADQNSVISYTKIDVELKLNEKNPIETINRFYKLLAL